jgi:hypothetical protein
LIGELLSDLLQRAAFDEDGAQCLIAALQRFMGVKKKPSEYLVVHDAGLKRLTIYRTESTLNANLNWGGETQHFQTAGRETAEIKAFPEPTSDVRQSRGGG